eukprot:COSAG01_NODE_61613_length_288_cov_1.645503_1_plen_59_part_10
MMIKGHLPAAGAQLLPLLGLDQVLARLVIPGMARHHHPSALRWVPASRPKWREQTPPIH